MRDDKRMKDMLIESQQFKLNFWVCEYSKNGGLGKVMRNIKPIYVQISIDESNIIRILEAKKEYDKYYFKPVVRVIKKDNTLGKILSYYSTTAGDKGLYFFDTEKEAIKQYNDLIFAYIQSIKLEKENTIKEFDQTIETLQESFIQSDYVMECLVRSN
jgi:hypothetical protein